MKKIIRIMSPNNSTEKSLRDAITYKKLTIKKLVAEE